MTFKESLDYGTEVEKEILSYLQKSYPSANKIEGKFKPFDIYIPETDTKIEIKTDVKSIETNNYVVEIEMYNKPSGLLSTKADWWILTDKEQMIWIKPLTLLHTIIKHNLKWVTFTGNGDNHPKKAYLIKKELLVSAAEKINNYPNIKL